MRILTDNDYIAPLKEEGKKLTTALNVPPRLFTLKGAKSRDITPDSRQFMRRLFVNRDTGQGFLRIMFKANVSDCDDAYDMTDFPPCFIRASDLVDEGKGEVYLLTGTTGHRIGFKNLIVGKTYHIVLHGFWDLSGFKE